MTVRESAPRRTIAREILNYLKDEIDFACVQVMAHELGISDQSARNVTGPMIEAGVLISERRRHQGTRKLFVKLEDGK